MKEQLEKIYECATQDLAKASSINDIEEIRGKYLSRKGEFNEIKKILKTFLMMIKGLSVLLQMNYKKT